MLTDNLNAQLVESSVLLLVLLLLLLFSHVRAVVARTCFVICRTGRQGAADGPAPKKHHNLDR